MSDKIDNLNLQVNANQYMPLRDVVFQSLRQAILLGQLKPGERLMEKSLADKMGVSRTPVREAIRKLELEGLVVMLPRKGAQVAEMTMKEIEDVLEIRAVLEGLASKLAAKRIREDQLEGLNRSLQEFGQGLDSKDVDMMIKKDEEFHDIIFEACNNDKLISIVNNLREQIHRFRVAYLKSYDDMQHLFYEHADLAKAVQEHDAEKAEKIATRHVEALKESMVKSLL